MNDITKNDLLQTFLELFAKTRSAFRQERTYQRALGLALGEMFVFSRHTVTQEMLSLGLRDADWSAWYRLFSGQRMDMGEVEKVLIRETLGIEGQEVYVVGADITHVPRSSQKMPGTSWAKAGGTAAFMPGIERSQRFLNLCWLTPAEKGYSRAIPIRFSPSFPEKAVPSGAPPKKDWQSALEDITWARQELDADGKEEQIMLSLVDGGFERVVEFWRRLPERVVLLGRSARSRALYKLPEYSGRGRPPDYGERAPKPHEWLRVKQGWQTELLQVRGRMREMRFRVEGPYVRDGLPEKPLFLIVVKGMDRKVNNKRVKRDPVYYTVSAIQKNGEWVLPLPVLTLLFWAWQRWELEVSHREMKSGFGLGDKQCWGQYSAFVSVQWSAYLYSLLLFAAYHSWGICRGPSPSSRWWKGSRRWSFNTLWQYLRFLLWGNSDFRAVWAPFPDNWLKKGDTIAFLFNSALSSAPS